MDAFAKKTQSRFSCYWKKKLFFNHWHLALNTKEKAAQVIREKQTREKVLHFRALCHLGATRKVFSLACYLKQVDLMYLRKKRILHAMSMIRRNASKLGTRISEAEDVRKAVSASFLNNHARTVAFALIPVARY
jgi:hypothetical protein